MKHLIPKELCTRCGACFAADRKKILRKDDDGFPVYDERDASDIAELLEVCSGENWNYRHLLETEYGADVSYDPSTPDIGVHRKIFLLSSSDKEWRHLGQSGGVSSTLLRFAFDSEEIDAALAVKRPNSTQGNPFSSLPFIAKNTDELKESFGSKYTICSSLELIGQISEVSSAFAVTLLPCQTVGLRRLMEMPGSDLRDKCKLIIGPYCGLNLETETGKALAACAGVEPSNIRSFKNRGGTFPGETTLELKDESKVYVDRTAHRILYRMYSPLRCYTCTDYGNELADISVADCWLKEKGASKFLHPEGAAYVICRSERGEAIVRRAIEAGYLLDHAVDAEKAKTNWEASFYHRKVRAHNRIKYWRKRGRKVPMPDYPEPETFKPSKLADYIEMGTWRLTRNNKTRKRMLAVWLWLARARKGSIRNLFFEDLKFYFFTHRYDQFKLKNFMRSGARYIRCFFKIFIPKNDRGSKC
jgi:coenzyme F420 hydrogenase subunit beta